MRALELAESVLGREAAVALVNDGLEEPVTFFRYPKEGEYLLNLRDRILLAVEEKLK